MPALSYRISRAFIPLMIHFAEAATLMLLAFHAISHESFGQNIYYAPLARRSLKGHDVGRRD